MNRERMERLVEALESNTYTQIRNISHRDGCFCAVGVAYNIMVEEGHGYWEGSLFKAKTGEWGLTSNIGSYYGVHSLIAYYQGRALNIIKLNDLYQLTLPEIGALLRETHLEEAPNNSTKERT